jgi:hypothetical protein
MRAEKYAYKFFGRRTKSTLFNVHVLFSKIEAPKLQKIGVLVAALEMKAG